MDLKNIKSDFPIFEDKSLVYLDNGATTQRPQYVIDKVDEYYKKCNANPHRGAYNLSVESTEAYQNARSKVASFINADFEEIVFTRNATEGSNLMAYSYGLDNLNEGDEVVISIMEHHANLVPWQQICKKKKAILKYIYLNDNFELDEKEIEEKITDKTKVVAIAHVSNVLGTINDVKKIAEIAHSHGAICIVDASQSIPHMKIDVKDINCDALFFSGHKMLAPFGIGVLFCKKDILNKMEPFNMGGDMIEYVYEDHATWNELPHKFEAGTPNVGGAVGLAAAIDYLEKIGYDKIQENENELMEYALSKLKQIPCLELYVTPNKENRTGVLSFNVHCIHAHDVSSVFNEKNVCIRAGNHCAQPLLRYMGIDATCRASFYFYNTKEDVDKFIEALTKTCDMFKKYIKD